MMRFVDGGQSADPVLEFCAGKSRIKQFLFLMRNVSVAKVFDGMLCGDDVAGIIAGLVQAGQGADADVLEEIKRLVLKGHS